MPAGARERRLTAHATLVSGHNADKPHEEVR
jgi:hypothetical protein